jgi:hypothetical protein
MRSGQQTESLHQRLQALTGRMEDLLRHYEDAHDSRAVFTLVYSIMTRELDDHLDHMGLLDPEWIVDLAEVFAGRYFAAIDAFDAGRPTGRAWKVVFEALDAPSSVLEDAVFPMTAHIVHDLPLALLDANFDRPALASRLHDFDQVNRTMERSVDVIRQRVTCRYSPGLRFLDRMERRYDLVLNGYGIRMSRAQAWYDALRMRDPSLRDAAKRAIESRPVELVDSVRHARGTAAGMVFAVLRRVAAMFRRWPAPPPVAA